MSSVMIVLSCVLFAVCIALIVIVAIQTNRGEGLSGAISGQGNFNSNKKGGKDQVLKAATVVISVIFAVLVVVVNVLGYLA